MLPLDCVEPDTDFVGNDIRTEPVGNIITCQAICHEDGLCKFWSFDLQNQDCKLKNSDEGRTKADAIYSGAKYCDLRNEHKSK